MSAEVFSTAEQLHEISHLKRLAVGEWPWRSIKVIGIAAVQWGTYYFILVACINDSILHRFWDITTCTVYVTACHLEKSLIFKKEVEIRSHMCFPIYVQTYETYRDNTWLHFPRYGNGSLKTAKVTFRVTGKWCHSISHIRFPIGLPLHMSLSGTAYKT